MAGLSIQVIRNMDLKQLYQFVAKFGPKWKNYQKKGILFDIVEGGSPARKEA